MTKKHLVIVEQGADNANKYVVTDNLGNVTVGEPVVHPTYTVRLYKNKSETSGTGVLELYSSDATADLSTQASRLAIIQRYCRHCLVTQNLASVTYLDETDFSKDVDGNTVALDGTQGDVMLEIDTLYWKCYDMSTYWEIKFSSKEFDSSTATAHKFDGTIRKHRYIGVFNGYNDGSWLRSASISQKATRSQNIKSFCDQAQLGGASMTVNTYYISNMMDRMLVVLLHLFVYATKNIQTIAKGLNIGGTAESSLLNTNSNFSETGGWTQGTTDNYTQNCMTLGLMNYYGYQWQYDGDTICKGGGYKFATDASDHWDIVAGQYYSSAPSTWKEVTGCDTNTTWACISEIRGDTFLPFKPSSKKSSASYSQYYADEGGYVAGDRSSFSGSHVRATAGYAGLFSADAAGEVSISGWYYGARLAFSSIEVA